MALEMGSNAVVRRYKVHDCLGVGSMGAVYRATDRLTEQRVALKRITSPIDRLDFAPHGLNTPAHIQLALHFKMLVALQHPNIVGIQDYGFDTNRQPYFTMPLLDQPQTIIQAGDRQPTEVKIRLLVETLQALAYLHWHGVVHRNLKPSNVMVVDNQIKLLDFGLAFNHSAYTATAYTAPEILDGKPASAASDLFALGLIAYEMFAGRHPPLSEDATSAKRAHVDVWALGLNDELSQVLYHLLLKDPEHRYQEAEDVITFLCQAAGQPLPEPVLEIRESVLQPPQFIGRTTELSQLTDALRAAFSRQGGGWLVGGESGVGKSRLLNELASIALAEGALVLRGQALSEVGGPYQLWRSLLRQLVLTSTLDHTEASILKSIIPDLEKLVEHHVPDAPPLDPESAHHRLVSAVIELFRRQPQPMLILLEDLQWAGSVGIALIDRLTQAADHLPLLLVASYRDDEFPRLPQILPQTHMVKLKRLDQAQITELSAYMLGEVGQFEEIVNLLRRETEGNVFYLVEVMKALVEEAGGLSDFGKRTLPGKILAGGTRRIVQRRLNLAPKPVYSMLEIAAVAGRTLDLALISSAAPSSALDTSLMICANVTILEWAETQWRFAHDKLRDGLLFGLNDVKRAELHRRVGEAIEAVYPVSPDYLTALAYHFRQAGVREKAVRYLVQAGNYCKSLFANHEAIAFYRQAMTIMEENSEEGESSWQPVEISVYENLGDTLALIGKYSEARESYQNSLSRDTSADPYLLARLHRKVGATWSLEHFSPDALKRLDIAEAILGSEPLPGFELTWRREWVQIQLERIRAYDAQGGPSQTYDRAAQAQAIEYARALASSPNHPLPDPLVTILQTAVQSWDQGRAEQSEALLVEMFALSPQIPYLIN